MQIKNNKIAAIKLIINPPIANISSEQQSIETLDGAKQSCQRTSTSTIKNTISEPETKHQ